MGVWLDDLRSFVPYQDGEPISNGERVKIVDFRNLPISFNAYSGILTVDGDFGTPSIGDNTVTFVKLQDINTDKLIGRDTAGVGDPEEIGLSDGLEFTGTQAIRIADAGVTLQKLQAIATARVIGRVAPGTGVPTALTGTQVTTLLDVFTSTLQGVVPFSGGGTTNFLRADGTWAAPPGGSGFSAPVDPDDDYKLAYALAGDLAYADVKVDSTGVALTFGSIPGESGDLRFSHGTAIAVGRNQADSQDVSLVSFGVGTNDKLSIGSALVAGLSLDVATSQTHTLQVNGTDEYVFSSTSFDVKTNFVLFGSNPSSSGTLRFTQGTELVSGKASGGSSIPLMGWGIAGTDTLSFGSSTVNGIEFDTASGTLVQVMFNGAAAYDFSVTELAAATGNVLLYAGSLIFGTTPASSGLIRVEHADNVLFGRNQANTENVPLLRWGTASNDVLYFGSSSADSGKVTGIRWGVHTGGTFQFEVNGASEYTFDSSVADFTNNSLKFGTNPASAGTIRFPQVATVQFRNNANSADLSALRVGATADDVWIGDTTAGSDTSIFAATTITFGPGGGTEYSMSATTFDCNQNSITDVGFVEIGTTVATSGLVRVGAGASAGSLTLIAGLRADAGSTIPLLRWGAFGDNILAIGTTTDLVSIYARALTSVLFTLGTGTTVLHLTESASSFAQVAATSGTAPVLLTLTGAAHTGLTASTEARDINVTLARTVTMATGALTAQRAMRITAPTYAFVGASVITSAATLAISGAPVNGTNATITNSMALWVETGGLGIGAAPLATSGDLRFAQVATGVFRNNANSGNLHWLRLGSTADDIWLGDTPSGCDMTIFAATTLTLAPGGSAEYTFNATLANFGANQLSFGTNPATGGVINFAHGVTGASARNQANSADATIWDWGSAGNDILTIGDSSDTAGQRWHTKSVTDFQFVVNFVTEFTFSGTQLDCHSNALVNVATINGSSFYFALTGADLTNANQTLTVAGGNRYVLPAATLSASRDKTLSNSGAVDGEVIRIERRDTTANTMVIKDNGGSTIYTFPASVMRAADFRYSVAGSGFTLAGHVALL